MLNLLTSKITISDELHELAEALEDYAVGVRYPTDDFEPTADDAKTAYETALKIGEFFNV